MFPRSYKDPIPKDIVSGVVYNFQCDLCNESYYGESIRHLDIRSGNTNSATYDHLLHCDCLPLFDNFSILAHENRKHLLEINFRLFHVSLFNLVSLLSSKYYYKTLKKKLFVSIKHDLIIGRDMHERRRQKFLIKNLY